VFRERSTTNTYSNAFHIAILNKRSRYNRHSLNMTENRGFKEITDNTLNNVKGYDKRETIPSPYYNIIMACAKTIFNKRRITQPTVLFG